MPKTIAISPLQSRRETELSEVRGEGGGGERERPGFGLPCACRCVPGRLDRSPEEERVLDPRRGPGGSERGRQDGLPPHRRTQSVSCRSGGEAGPCARPEIGGRVEQAGAGFEVQDQLPVKEHADAG